MFRLSNNTALPEIPAYRVKSFWLLVITVLVTACNAFGFDLLGSFCEAGIGCSAEDVVAKGEHAVGLIQQLLPILTSLWLWVERRAPNFRLKLWGRAGPRDGIAGGSSALLLVLFLLTAMSPAMAASCADAMDVDTTLRQKFGEAVVARAIVDRQRPALFYANPETGSWTLVVLMDRQACAVASGMGWQAVTVKAGEPT